MSLFARDFEVLLLDWIMRSVSLCALVQFFDICAEVEEFQCLAVVDRFLGSRLGIP